MKSSIVVGLLKMILSSRAEWGLMSATESYETIITATATANTTTEAPLPGKTWVVMDDKEGGYNVTLPLGFGKVRNTIKNI